MTYQASEASKHDGKPVELFRYEGTYQNFYYTSGQKVISFQAPDEASPNDYIPLAMKRSGVPQTTQDDDNAEVTIEMPVSTDLVAIYGFQISPPALFLTIYRGHTPGEYVRYWSGEVENIQVARGTATVRVPSGLASALSADFPNVYYQTPCNHTLFDPRCGVDPEDWTVATSIDAIDGVNVTVDDIGTLDGMMLGGDALLPSGERRMIVAQTGNVITLNYPFASADPTDAITLMTGCDLAWAGDCKLRYDNTRRFGGFPFIPPKNIFRTGLEPGKDVTDESCLPYIPEFDGWYMRVRVSWINLLAPEPGLGCFLYLGGFASAQTRSRQVDYEYIEWDLPQLESYGVNDYFLQSQYGGSQNASTKGLLSYRRWDQPNYSIGLPVPPSDYMDEGGGYWDVHGIGPVNQYFNF